MSAHNHSHTKPETSPKNPFLIPFFWICIFGIIELAAGFWTNSLALLGDAGHMASDAFALGLAGLASSHHRRLAATDATMRWDLELTVSIFNAACMLLVTGWIIWEAILRLHQPQAIDGLEVAIIAFLGLVVNLIVARQLHQYEAHDSSSGALNHRAALLHVLGDLLGSLAALIAGLVVYYTAWYSIDPLLSLLIAALILVATLRLLRDIGSALFKS